MSKEDKKLNTDGLKSNDLERDFTMLSFLKYVFPIVAAYVFNGLYSIVDGIFIERAEGPFAIAAVNLFAPLQNLMIATGLMIGTGGSVALANMMGKRDYDGADRLFSYLVYFATAVSIIFTAIGIIFKNPLMTALGATDGNIGYFGQYYTVMILSTPFVIFAGAASPLLLGEGRTGDVGVLTVMGGIINIVLDAVFINIFHWGIRGAAIATVLGFSVFLFYGIYFYFPTDKHGSAYHIRIVKIKFGELFPVLYNGMSDMVSNLASGITALIMNRLAYKCSGEVGVSVVSVYLYLQFLIMAAFMGLTGAAEPLISYHRGSGNDALRKKVLRLSMLWTAIISIAITLLTVIFSRQISGIFFKNIGDEAVFFIMAVRSIRLMAPACLIVGFNILFSGLFTAYSNGTVSALLSALRTFVILIIAMLSLTALFGDTGLWTSWLVAELISLLVSIVFLLAYGKRYDF